MEENGKPLPILLRWIAPFSIFVPIVEKPKRPVSFRERCLWTVLALLFYLVCCQIPLYGIMRNTSSDPFMWFRMVVASNRGTLMELGITPIATSSMIVQLMVSSNFIKFDKSDPYHKKVFLSAQKIFAMFAIFFESAILIRSGLYGSFDQLGIGNIVIIASQLCLAGIVVLLLDEMLEKGYGLGSGISLFIATNVCESIFWNCFSPTTLHTAKGIQFEGAVVEVLHVGLRSDRSLKRLFSAATREDFPNICNLLSTCAVCLIVIYLEDFKFDLPLSKRGVRGVIGNFTIKLIPMSTFPVIFQTTIVANFHMFSKILYRRYSHNFLVRLIGRWEAVGGQYSPVGGLAYYLRPVRSIHSIFGDPMHFLLHVFLIALLCGVFSMLWMEASGSSPKSQARMLDSQGIQFYKKSRKETLPTIEKNVFPSTILGGVAVGILTVLSQITGALMSGTGIFMTVNLIFSYYQLYRKEKN